MTLLDLELGPEREPDFFRTPEDVYATGLMFLAERFHHLLDAEDDLGLIVVDSRFREDDQRLRRFFADLTKDGTPYMQLPRIVEGLFLGPSHYSIGLQCADLIVAMTANAERGPGQGRGYLKKLLPRFAVHPATGELDGVGLKRFPEAVPRPRGAPPAVLSGRVCVLSCGHASTHYLQDELVRELDRRVGARRRSGFIARAVEAALDDERRWELIESSLGSIEANGHEWDDDPAFVGARAAPRGRAPRRLMAAILLDTTVVIDLLRGRAERGSAPAGASRGR